MNKKLIIGNWKMNPVTIDEAKQIAKKVQHLSPELKKTETVICPPFVFIQVCSPKDRISNFHMGAQSVSKDEEGPHTGEVGAKILVNMGVEYVIVGHSEERERGDTNEIVSKKIKIILDAGMKPVVCVGEKARDTENGSHFEFLKQQIKETFADVPKKYAKDIVLAYEPVWAIGVSEPMSSDQIYEMTIFIRKVLSDIFDASLAMKAVVLYGGSVNFRNAFDIITTGKVDGLLVGRESVNITGFSELLKVVDTIS
ncbi:MAG: triose-phosphate isomerase [Candidatus Paceibacterota bacterium]|jgi:triosephosphate isomerase